MDEESLFRDIHSHLLRQAREGGKMDTETKLAERFQVSRYHVRQVLAVMSQMGIVERTQKKGMTITSPQPEQLSRHIENQLKIGRFDVRELAEARVLFDTDLIRLAVRRITPANLGLLTDIVRQMTGCVEFRQAFLKFHLRFWQTVFEAAGNRVLQVFATSLLVQSAEYLEKHTDELEPVWFSDLLEADRAVLAAFRRGDEERAAEAAARWLSREYQQD
ncbi:MAG: FCD domain-containing protein [Sutterella sp.]|nr:FCD domain-containing protein [Sutterella sp.]